LFPRPSGGSLNRYALGNCRIGTKAQVSLWRSTVRKLEVPEEFEDWDFGRLGDSDQGVNRDILFSPLDFANVFRVQIRPFREFFLRQFCGLPALSDCLSQNFSMSWNLGSHKPSE
jgi:hypothetical protein